MTPKLTNNGYGILTQALNGGSISFTKIKVGNGDVPEDYTALDDLVNPVIEAGIDSIEEAEKYVILKSASFNNQSLESELECKEVGVFCLDSDGETEILYAYGHCDLSSSGETAVTIPLVENGLVSTTITVYVYIDDAEEVGAILAASSEYVTLADFTAHTDDTDNPHSVTASQVGLGNVPNVATNDQTPTYTAPTTLTALVSGEKLSTAFGKLALAVTKLIDHIADSTLHLKNASSTVGGTAKPVYLNAGTVTACSASVGGTARPAYLNSGTVTACSATVGNTRKPVYLNAGTVTPCGWEIQYGVVGVQMNTQTATNFSVTFSSAFSSAPKIVMLTPQHDSETSVAPVCKVRTWTKSGFVGYMYDSASNATSRYYQVFWIAIL
ncbi:MAG: hypothetical protein LUG45_00965 [Clostridiales bacterium]|nr:hypothetical protein [Clostridiales bacterium]